MAKAFGAGKALLIYLQTQKPALRGWLRAFYDALSIILKYTFVK